MAPALPQVKGFQPYATRAEYGWNQSSAACMSDVPTGTGTPPAVTLVVPQIRCILLVSAPHGVTLRG